MSTDSEVIEKLCSMDDLDRVFYMNTFKSDSRTLEDNVAKEILEISNRELDCVVLESMLVDVDEINKQECTLVLEFYVDIEYRFDESESIEPTEKYPDIFGNPEVQKAIAEMNQKPSLFQRIKNWFTN